MGREKGLVRVIGRIALSGGIRVGPSGPGRGVEPFRDIPVGLAARGVTDQAEHSVLAGPAVFLQMIFVLDPVKGKRPLLRLQLGKRKLDKDQIRILTILLQLRPGGIADQGIFGHVLRCVIEDDVIEPVASRHYIKKKAADQDQLYSDHDIG